MSDAVEVCPECDIAGCRHIRASKTDMEDQLAAQVALIRHLVAEMKYIRKTWPGTCAARTAHAALIRAKEAGYERA